MSVHARISLSTTRWRLQTSTELGLASRLVCLSVNLSSFAASLVRMEGSVVAFWNAHSGQARLINVLLTLHSFSNTYHHLANSFLLYHHEVSLAPSASRTNSIYLMWPPPSRRADSLLKIERSKPALRLGDPRPARRLDRK